MAENQVEALLRWDYDGCRSVCTIIQLSGKSIMAAVEPTVEVGRVSFWADTIFAPAGRFEERWKHGDA